MCVDQSWVNVWSLRNGALDVVAKDHLLTVDVRCPWSLIVYLFKLQFRHVRFSVLRENKTP